MTYPAIFSRRTGVQLLSLGCSGNCKLQDYFCDVLCAADVDAFIFDSFSNPTEEQIKERLEKLGYTVHTALGNRNNRISLAVYDEQSDRYLVGVILDTDAFASSSSSMERDVYKPKFLEARGWTLMRVWCRDFWLSPQKVVKAIASAAEKNRG